MAPGGPSPAGADADRARRRGRPHHRPQYRGRRLPDQAVCVRRTAGARAGAAAAWRRRRPAMLSLRRRLVLVHLLAILVAVGATATAGWWLLTQSVNRQLDGALLALAEAEVAMLADGDGSAIRVHEAPTGS